MHHFLYPQKDAYITSQTIYNDKNYGLDEMLQIGVSQSYGRVRTAMGYWTSRLGRTINRTLIKFDLSSISQSINLGDITSPSFNLKLKLAKGSDLPLSYKIHAFPVSQSWDMGNGYWSDGGSDEGASWLFKNGLSGSFWYLPYESTNLTTSIDYINDYGATSESFNRGGGTWYNLNCSQSFDYESADLNMNVTPIVDSWLNGTYPNEGLILMISTETNVSGSDANLMFFSRETNTIYSPFLDIKWDDSSYNTSSLLPLSSSKEFVVVVQNLKKEYSSVDVPRINVFSREKYTLKDFVRSTQQTAHLVPRYLSSSSYYGIKDNISEEVIVGFDDYTKISCDENGNYFFIDVSGLPQERYYRILIKTIFEDGSIYTFDNNDVFKVRR